MSVAYMDLVLQEVRLVILRLLAESPEFTSNSSVLDMALDSFGLSLSTDQVDTQLAWLAEQGLVSIERISTITRAQITRRGDDVARGQATVPGVKRPGPKT